MKNNFFTILRIELYIREREKWWMIAQIITLFSILLISTNSWAVSWAQRISSKDDVAEFCFRTAKDSSLELKIKHNIDVELPLFEIEKIIDYNEMWYPEIDLSEIYEIKFPEEWKCQTLVPLWYIKTFNELQEIFKNKTKSKLSDQVSHHCKINGKQIDGRELEGKYIFKIEKSTKEKYGYQFIRGKEKSTYRFTKGFKAKVADRCLNEKIK